MAETVCSLIKVTLDPGGLNLVLLNYGDKMLAEPKFGQNKQSQTQAFLRAEHVKVFDRGNRTNTLNFSRIVTHASNLAVREYILDHTIALDAVSNIDVRIDLNGSLSYWTLANANLTGVGSSYGRGLSMNVARSNFDYAITGGLITKTTI